MEKEGPIPLRSCMIMTRVYLMNIQSTKSVAKKTLFCSLCDLTPIAFAMQVTVSGAGMLNSKLQLGL